VDSIVAVGHDRAYSIILPVAGRGIIKTYYKALLKLQITPNYGIAIFLKMNVRALLDNLFFLLTFKQYYE